MTAELVATRPRGASGVLLSFVEAGVLESADVHVARRLSRLGGETGDAVLLAAALAVRAVRHGSVCLDLAAASGSVGVEDADEETLERLSALQWPQLGDWLAALGSSPLVARESDGDGATPLRLVGGLLYLDRYWRQERVIAGTVDERRRREPPPLDLELTRSALGRLFDDAGADRQRLATAVAATSWVHVLAGGPGTGKTTTVAKLLAVLRAQPDPRPRVALAAPTGKAAARLEEAVRSEVAKLGDVDQANIGDLTAMTIHRLLGWKPGARTRFKHDRDNRLPYDVVVVDEASMVSVTLMARLVEALRTDARLVLVGDPDQLASVEAGAVLGDLVQRPAPTGAPADTALDDLVPRDLADLTSDEADRARTCGVVTLTLVHRHGGNIRALAEAVKRGDAEEALRLLDTRVEVELVPVEDLAGVRADVIASGGKLSMAAEAGDAQAALLALGSHRLLCAHRRGPFGVAHWGLQVEEWLREALPDYSRGGLWYVGRPLLVMSNDRDLGLYNGDTGVVVRLAGQPKAVFPKGQGVMELATNRLSDVTTVHAMSVHKSQGSQFDRVSLVLPEPTSPLLTKELFYTAVTRAQSHVRVIGTEESVRAAVGRRIQRASGLAANVY